MHNLQKQLLYFDYLFEQQFYNLNPLHNIPYSAPESTSINSFDRNWLDHELMILKQDITSFEQSKSCTEASTDKSLATDGLNLEFNSYELDDGDFTYKLNEFERLIMKTQQSLASRDHTLFKSK